MNLHDLAHKYFPTWDKHQPTKLCPHRYCRAAHHAATLLCLPFLAFMLFNAGIWYLLFIVMLCVIMTGAERMVWKRPRMELETEDRASRIGSGGGATVVDPEGSDSEPIKLGGRNGTLLVRRGWARAAIVCDTIVLGAVVWAVSHLASTEFTVPAGGDADVLGLAVGVGFFAFSAWAHRKATEPAKPLRLMVRVPGSDAA